MSLEPSSKSPEEDNEAGELDKAEEIRSVVFPSDKDAALPLYPSKQAEMLGNGCKDRHGEQHDANRIDQTAKHEPDSDHDRQDVPGAGTGAEQKTLGGFGESGHRQHARIKVRAKQQQQQRARGAANV